MYPSLCKCVCINNNSIVSCTIDYTTFAVSGKVGTLSTRFDHTSWMTVVAPTDRNRCVIVVIGGVFVLSIGFRIFCWFKDFCHRTESNLLLFLTINAMLNCY